MTDLIGTVWSCLDGVAEVSPSAVDEGPASYGLSIAFHCELTISAPFTIMLETRGNELQTRSGQGSR